MPRCLLLFVLLLAASPMRASDEPSAIKNAFENPKMRGEAVFRWLGLPLYTARLYTPNGQALTWARPVALQLIYARKISRQSLVDATVSELERLEGSQADHAVIGEKFASCFRDVDEGDQFVATTITADEVQLFFNGTAACRVSHDNLSARFLGIWLSDNSRSPDLTRQLRGG